MALPDALTMSRSANCLGVLAALIIFAMVQRKAARHKLRRAIVAGNYIRSGGRPRYGRAGSIGLPTRFEHGRRTAEMGGRLGNLLGRHLARRTSFVWATGLDTFPAVHALFIRRSIATSLAEAHKRLMKLMQKAERWSAFAALSSVPRPAIVRRSLRDRNTGESSD